MHVDLPRTLLVLLAGLLAAGCGAVTEGFGIGERDDDDAGNDDDDGDDDSSAVDDDDSAGGDDDDDSAGDDDDDDSADLYVEPDVFVSPQDFEAGDTLTVHYRGDLVKEPNLGIRYGFDGYSQIEGVEGYETEYVDGASRSFFEAEMLAGEDEFTCELAVPEAARAIQMTFYSTDEEELRTWDDRDSLGYHQQVIFPYIGPLLAWTDEAQPGTGVVVTFETSMPCRGTVEYGSTEALGSSAMGEEADYLHHVLLTDLTPDSEIHYRVLDNVGHASELLTFRTPPTSESGMWSFAVVSDAQDHGDGYQSWGAVAAELNAQHEDLTLVLMPGDLFAADEAGDWWTFFDGGRELFARAPIVAAHGNNDTGYYTDFEDSAFVRYLPRPSSTAVGYVHRIDVRNAAFLSLDTEETNGLAAGGDQNMWVGNQLADIASAGAPSWVFAQWHVPAYDVGTRTSESSQEQVREVTLTFEGSVDWVFQGHEHLAQRLLPLRHDGQLAASGNYGRSADDGVGYVVLPSSGTSPRTTVVSPEGDQAHYRDWLAFPEIDAEETNAPSELGWAHVTLDGDTFSLEIYGMGVTGSLVTPYVREEFSYERP